MSVLTIPEIKAHLNIPCDYMCDDELLASERESAEAYVTTFLDLEDEDEATITAALSRKQVKHAMLMIIATLYNNRESEVYAGTQEMKAFDRLLYQYKRWSV